jgi:putative membrane protein
MDAYRGTFFAPRWLPPATDAKTMKKNLAVLLSLALPFGLATAAENSKDSEFAMKAAQGGMAEVSTGQLAANKGSDPKIKEFGQRMATDHGKANDELKAAAQKSGITLPAEASKKQQDDTNKLGQKQGKDFDEDYAKMMVKDHEEDVALFQKEADSGSDPNLKSFAQKTLPTLKEHLSMAKELPGAPKKK